MKNVRKDTYKQLKTRARAIKASLSNVLPPQLDCELYMHTIKCMNMTPNKFSYPLTPFQIVTNSKPFLPRYYFAHFRRKDNSEIRNEWGIFIGYVYGDSSNYLRAYLPTRKIVYSRRTFKPNPNLPHQWNFQKRNSLKPPPTDVITSVTPNIINESKNNLQYQEGEASQQPDQTTSTINSYNFH